MARSVTAAARALAGVGIGLALLAAPLAAGAWQDTRVFRVGILSNLPLDDPRGAPLWEALLQGLREFGYVRGQNMAIEHRSSEGKYERLPALAAELVRLKVDVIVVPAGNAVAARQATRTIPIVMASGSDPEQEGLVESLARPGGNVTGTTAVAGPEVTGKRMQLLKEAVPRVSRVAVLWNPANRYSAQFVEEAKAASRSLGLRLQMTEARAPDQLEGAFAAMRAERADAILTMTDGVFLLHRTRIAELARKHRLPTMFGTREFVDAGGLMSYSPSAREGFHRAARYVDRILKGAKPRDLPIERPSRLELVVNLKAARALGVTVPPSLVMRADQVIE